MTSPFKGGALHYYPDFDLFHTNTHTIYKDIYIYICSSSLRVQTKYVHSHDVRETFLLQCGSMIQLSQLWFSSDLIGRKSLSCLFRDQFIAFELVSNQNWISCLSVIFSPSVADNVTMVLLPSDLFWPTIICGNYSQWPKKRCYVYYYTIKIFTYINILGGFTRHVVSICIQWEFKLASIYFFLLWCNWWWNATLNV